MGVFAHVPGGRYRGFGIFTVFFFQTKYEQVEVVSYSGAALAQSGSTIPRRYRRRLVLFILGATWQPGNIAFESLVYCMGLYLLHDLFSIVNNREPSREKTTVEESCFF